MPDLQYVLVTGMEPIDLAEHVAHYLSEGFVPWGDPFHTGPDGRMLGPIYAQAMVTADLYRRIQQVT